MPGAMLGCRWLVGLLLLLILLVSQATVAAEDSPSATRQTDPSAAKSFTLADYAPPPDGKSDATAALQKLFDEVAQAGGGSVTIPPGRYYLPGTAPVKLSSQTRVSAAGATFLLPETLADQARVILFQGENIRDFSWCGGTFIGHCFDPNAETNRWEPNVNTRMIVVTTTAGGVTDNLQFRDVQSRGIAGAVIDVSGCAKPGYAPDVTTFATSVTVENCTLLESGKFMWDYGYLWQITVWPEDYTPSQRAMAAKYFPEKYIRGELTLADGDDRVRMDNRKHPLPIAKTAEAKYAICFCGDALPANVQRGKQYFVVESQPEYIKIADSPAGEPIRFRGAAGPQVKLIDNLQQAFFGLFAPSGSGPGKGGLDLVGCKTVRVSGCKLSARGDTMHIQRCHNVVFSNNQIVGSRMGAFFLAEYCKNATITGNSIDGTNGSRVMSVEKSCEDVTIVGNTFRNGGRGSWINQPKNIIIQANVFVNNTTKCEHDPRRGRRTFVTGDYEIYPEMYFTLYQPDGRYEAVIVKDNIFKTGPECGPLITFAKNGSQIVVTGNLVSGAGREIKVDPECTDVIVRDNPGAK